VCNGRNVNVCARNDVNEHEKIFPPALLPVLNNEGYLRYEIKCVKQAYYLFKLLFHGEKIELNSRKIKVRNITYKLEANEVGVYISAPETNRISNPEINESHIRLQNSIDNGIRELRERCHLSQSREDYLLCLNFLIHPRKVTYLKL